MKRRFEMVQSLPAGNTIELKWYQQRVVALCMALIALLLTHLSAYGSGRGLFQAWALAAFVALISFTVIRVIQTKGKLTIGLVAIVLPTLAAIACFGFLRLTPFVDRQMLADQMRKERIMFDARAPSQSGEWLSDRHGYMLPTWLAQLIGSDCMSVWRGIDGDVRSLERLPLDRIETASLFGVSLAISQPDTLSPRVVDWLNEKVFSPSEDKRLEFTLYDLGSEDLRQLRRLQSPYQLTVHIKSPRVQLEDLGKADYVRVLADSLTVEQVEQLAMCEKLTFLALDTVEISPEVVRALSSLPPELVLQFNGQAMDEKTMSEIAKLQQTRFQFHNVQFKKIGKPAPVSTLGDTEVHVNLAGPRELNSNKLANLVNHLGCTTLGLSQMPTPLSDGDLKFLWGNTSLRELRDYSGQTTKIHVRPAEAAAGKPEQD